MDSDKLITIELTPDDAALFLVFRKYQDTFAAIVESGVFNIRQGGALFWFDEHGVLNTIRETRPLNGKE
jgi:hypothetical protein